MPAGHDISSAAAEPQPVLYLTDDDESLRGDGQLILEDYIELAAPYAMDLLAGALLSIQTDLGDGALTLTEDVYISSRDETVDPRAQVVLEDFYECSAPFALELAPDALMTIQTDRSPLMGVDASGAFLEIVI